MSRARHDPYLESKVLTAPPQRLHLLLIEAAIRFGRQAGEALRRGEAADADRPLTRVVDIVGELLAGVRHQRSDLNKQIAELYWYLFRTVSEAKIKADPEKLAAALRLLEYERETWQLVCEKFAAHSAGPSPSSATRPPTTPPDPPTPRVVADGDSAPTSGLSLEA